MRFKLYDYLEANGRNLIKEWTMALQKAQRAKLNERLDKLALYGTELRPEMLTGTDTPGIMKLRIRGNVQLRPMLCEGPIRRTDEFTLLVGAIERDGKLEPRNADAVAARYRAAIEADIDRRKIHERVS